MSQIRFPQSVGSLHRPPRTVHHPGRPEEFVAEPPLWGPITAGAALRTFAQWTFLAASTRADAIGNFARRARSDSGFPTDPTVVIRYLVANLAPAEVLDAALEAVEEYRAWQDEGLELALRDVASVNSSRADALRKSLERSQAAREELFAADAALADVNVDSKVEPAEDDQDQDGGKRGSRRGRSRS